jgi:DICT domain-containing protein
MEAAVWETDARGNPCGSGLCGRLVENHFYLFESEALQAVTHAVEDYALEEANGVLLAAVQDFAHFESNRERYWQLAATLDQVQVLGTGKTPRRHGHLKFCNTAKTNLNHFWTVLFYGPRTQAMLLCQQVNREEQFDSRKFIGFYTFNRDLIEHVRQEITESMGGKCPNLREFSRLRTIDQAAKQLKGDFADELESVEVALRKLQTRGAKYQAKHFVSDLEKTIERLQQWKVRLPELLAAQNK